MSRKIIYECRWGSQLFGTSTPESDEDFLGVFLPSEEDFFGLGSFSDEWEPEPKTKTERNTAGDVDRKYFSLQKFCRMAGQGQPQVLEMLFAPNDMVVTTSAEWEAFKVHRDLFISREAVVPFVKFARSQAYKAVLKGEHYNLIVDLIRSLKEVSGKTSISSYFKGAVLAKNAAGREEGQVDFFGHKLRLFRNDHGFLQLDIVGVFYDPGCKIKMLRNSLETRIKDYGSRVKSAAEDGYDHRSLLHCLRQLNEAEEFLKTGKITLPRPPEEVEFLMKIKRKEYPTPDVDLFSVIDNRISEVETEAVASSVLPGKVDWQKINSLCISVHRTHFLKRYQ